MTTKPTPSAISMFNLYTAMFKLRQSSSTFQNYFFTGYMVFIYIPEPTDFLKSAEGEWWRVPCISYPNKVHPEFKFQLHFNYFLNVCLHICPLQLPALHSLSDFLPSCKTFPETYIRLQTLTETRHERKFQVVRQSSYYCPRIEFQLFFNLTSESMWHERSKAWPENTTRTFLHPFWEQSIYESVK